MIKLMPGNMDFGPKLLKQAGKTPPLCQHKRVKSGTQLAHSEQCEQALLARAMECEELNMSTAGLSRVRLERMHHVLSGYIERKALPGLVALVSRHDDVHMETLGTLSFDNLAPMKQDTIFRIALLTKLITAVAAMILVEVCKIRLDEPIEGWLPELANRRVLTSLSSQLDETIPAARAITVRDVLTYTMGFGSVMAMPDTYPIQKLIRDYRIGGDGPPRPAQAPDTEEWLQKLGPLPWMAQPGERWLYNVSGDVLGVLIARVSGQSLGTFMLSGGLLIVAIHLLVQPKWFKNYKHRSRLTMAHIILCCRYYVLASYVELKVQ